MDDEKPGLWDRISTSAAADFLGIALAIPYALGSEMLSTITGKGVGLWSGARGPYACTGSDEASKGGE